MVFLNEKYEITVKETVGYSINSTDNKYYDQCIKIIDADMFGHYSSYEMEVTSYENGENSLQLNEEYISFKDFEGNTHKVDWSGKQRKYEKAMPIVVTINMNSVKTPRQFQSIIKQMLCMPDFYGMNWDAYWDAITGLIALPDELRINGWHIYKSIQKDDAELFEKIMKEYNGLKCYKHCECIYNKYI